MKQENAAIVGSSRAWKKSVRAACAEGDEFVFCAPAILPIDISKPLLIIVHPGDAIEDGYGYRDEVEKAKVIAFGKRNTEGMAAEIKALLPIADVVILHRQSSIDVILDRKDVISHSAKEEFPFEKLCNKASKVGTVLWGDDLEDAARWISENMQVNARPSVHMTGAFACAEYGCITKIGKYLEKEGCTTISVSEHAPSDLSNFAPRWVPGGEVPNKKNRVRP